MSVCAAAALLLIDPVQGGVAVCWREEAQRGRAKITRKSSDNDAVNPYNTNSIIIIIIIIVIIIMMGKEPLPFSR